MKCSVLNTRFIDLHPLNRPLVFVYLAKAEFFRTDT